MVGAALDQDVAGFEQHLALVHQRVDFARQDDRVVDRIGLVKAGMPWIAAVKRLMATGPVVRRFAIAGQCREPLRVRRILDDAEHAAVRRRGQAKFALTASSLPRLSAGELRVAHNSLTTVLPVPRLKTCGTSPSMMKMDLPWASWPVTTRRTAFGICSS